MDDAKKMMCPYWKMTCEKAQKKYQCAFWTHIYGKDPQTEDMIDRFGCAVAWMPVLLIENAQMSRQAGAAVESFRNEMVKQNQQFNDMIASVAERKMLK